jgi:dihydrofolate reductase
MRVSIIVAMATNGVIGRDGKLPWRLSDDLRRFKRLTMGHTIVMGRRTWESIGRPLPGRRTIIVSRRLQFGSDAEDVAVAASFDEALRIAESAGGDEAFIVGGSQLYREALPRADRLYITRVLARIDGDTYFPSFDQSEWRLVSSQHHSTDSVNEYPCEFETYERLRIV